MAPLPFEDKFSRYVRMRENQGWTLVTITPVNYDFQLVDNWLKENAGEELNFSCWDEDALNSTWEDLGSGEYLIKNKEIAILAKLTFHGV